jgi:hypothetical protein
LFTKIYPFCVSTEILQSFGRAAGVGTAALVAETLVQRCFENKANPNSQSTLKYTLSWGCKALQLGVVAELAGFKNHWYSLGYIASSLSLSHLFFKRCEACSLFSLKPASKFRIEKMLLDSLSNGWLGVSLASGYRYLMSLGIGYWVDRSVQLTTAPGPVMGVVSLALGALSFWNARYDFSHRPTPPCTDNQACGYSWPVEKIVIIASLVLAISAAAKPTSSV